MKSIRLITGALLLLGSALAAAPATPAAPGASGIKIDLDGRKDQIALTGFSAGKPLAALRPAWLKGEEQATYLMIQGPGLKNPAFEPFTFSFVPQKDGTVMLNVRSTTPTKNNQTIYVAYGNFAVTGAELKNGDLAEITPAGVPANWAVRPGLAEKGVLYGTHDVYGGYPLKVKANQKVTVAFAARTGVVTENKATPFKAPAAAPAAKLPRRAAENEPKEYYSYYDSEIKLLPFKDKGISGDSVVPSAPGRKPKRALPAPLFTTTPRKNATGSLDFASVKVELLEEGKVARNAAVRFGFPLPEGGLFSAEHLRLLGPDGREVPAQYTITAFWPDDSVKWVLIQFIAPLKAGEKAFYTVEAGNKVSRQASAAGLTVKREGDVIRLDTGKLAAEITRSGVRFAAGTKALGELLNPVIADQDGKEFTFIPDAIALEESGDRTATVKIDGAMGDLARGVLRLRFYAGSMAVEGSLQTVITNLKNEFTDLDSLRLSFVPAKPVTKLEALSTAGTLTKAAPGRFFQLDDQTFRQDGKADAKGRLSGGVLAETAEGSRFGAAIRDLAFRYPKAVSSDGKRFNFELLPLQGSPDFGKQLPGYLRFPYLEGRYRLKWGMAFSESFRLDFAPEVTAAKVDANVNLPVIAVVERDWYFRTAAIPGASPASDHSFDAYDQKIDKALIGHLESKAKQREYGFLNYGDWYGERGHNWGNNEYDLAHGMTVHFIRTGNRLAARLASLAARHQADVDIIHAYRDPYFIGGNAEHSVGHTGLSFQRADRSSWSYRLDHSFSAENGHTWSQGMLNDWQLNGDAAVMNSALMLGEQINNYMAPDFQHLGSHERSAGWSLKAVMALYGATSDPAYLESARAIAKVAFDEQNFAKGGAWPHVLPGPHCNNHPDSFGNCPFLIGVLLEGLVQYHRETKDPAAAKAIISGANWLASAFLDDAAAWPYGASWDGKPYNAPAPNLNVLIAPAVIYAANLDQDNRKRDIAAAVLDRHIFTDLDPAGKALSINLATVPGLLDGIARWNAAHPDRAYQYRESDVLKQFLKGSNARFNVRAPDRKVFRLRLEADNPRQEIVRTPYGARPTGKPESVVTITDAAGKTVYEKKVSTKQPWRETVTLPGRKGDELKLTIDDDMTAVWDLPPSPDCDAALLLAPDSTVGCRSTQNYVIDIPAGSKELTVKLTPIHPGGYGGILADQDGNILRRLSGVKAGTAARLPWLAADAADNLKTNEKVTFPAAAKERKFRLLVWSAGDLGIGLSGVPAELRIR